MVRLRTCNWPATVIDQEKVVDNRPSSRAMRWVSVQVFGKGESVVKACEIFPYPPPKDYYSKKPNLWKTSMDLAAAAISLPKVWTRPHSLLSISIVHIHVHCLVKPDAGMVILSHITHLTWFQILSILPDTMPRAKQTMTVECVWPGITSKARQTSRAKESNNFLLDKCLFCSKPTVGTN